MKFEKRCVYENDRGGYMLILNSTGFGVSIVNLYNPGSGNNPYKNFPELFVDDICGYVAFDRVVYIPWAKVGTRHFSLHKKLSKKQFGDIVHYISDFYLGNINPVNTIFGYTEDTEEEESKDKDVINRNNGKNVNEHSRDNNTSTVERHADTTTFRKACIIPVHGDAIKDVTKKEDKYYDLLSTQEKESHYSYSKPGSENKDENTTVKIKHSLSRKLFSKEECLEIAKSQVSHVAKNYNVPYHKAELMIRNAKKIFSPDNNTEQAKVDNRLKEYYAQGLSYEEVCEKLPDIQRSRIENYFKLKSIPKDNVAALKKWDAIIEKQDVDQLLHTCLNINKFAYEEKCSYNIAQDIVHKIYDILSLNPFYVVFRNDGYSNDLLDKISSDKSAQGMINTKLYNKIKSIEEAYRKSYYQHNDILAGFKCIPSEIKDEDAEFFMSIIYNRFNINRTAKSTRQYTKNQKEAFDNKDIEKICMTMAVNYKKAVGMVHRYIYNK